MRISDWSSDVCSSDLVVITGFGDTPGQPQMLAEFMVHGDRGATRASEQTVGRGVHEQAGHQIFEQGGAPRHQRDALAAATERATQMQPVAKRYIALGDRDEADRKSKRLNSNHSGAHRKASSASKKK